MSYLLDTNVLSETVRTEPNPAVLRWLSQVPDHRLHVSVLTLGEIRKGVERLAPGTRRERLRLWLEHDLSGWFGGRVLPVDRAVADRWGRLLGETGRSLPAIDSLLAATALHHELRLVTRNRQDFLLPGLDVIDPWEWP
ncbi:MAG: type II toxin-antitoxin system VapC family toxin [Magnetococcales bacterium]|nr:type II toxin-antitoxin system VapC family toxin [Magnetococcales bacterium]